MKKQLIILAAIVLGFASCGKLEKDVPFATPAQLILGNWDMFSRHTWSKKTGATMPFKDTTIYTYSNYFRFGSDGKAIVELDTVPMVLNYAIVENNNKLQLGASVYSIVKLDYAQLVIENSTIKGDTTTTVNFTLLK